MSEVTGGSVPSAIWRNFVMEAAPLVEQQGSPPEEQLVAANAGAATLGRCDFHACSAQYRSFRAADCSYQPYGGGARRACPFGQPDATMADLESGFGTIDPEAAVAAETAADAVAEPAMIGGTCDVAACAARYSSFRASDCTYQPFDGPRRVCGSGDAEVEGPPPVPEEVVEAVADHPPPPPEPRRMFGGLFSFLGGGSRGEPVEGTGGCNFDACAAKYSSFDPGSCSYQPLDGGPRRSCTE
jgi:hypothetical protein